MVRTRAFSLLMRVRGNQRNPNQFGSIQVLGHLVGYTKVAGFPVAVVPLGVRVPTAAQRRLEPAELRRRRGPGYQSARSLALPRH